MRFQDFRDNLNDTLAEQNTNLPKEVFIGLDYERSEKLSSSKRDVIIVRSKDREDDRDEILRNLKQQDIEAKIGSGSSSVDPIDGTHEDKAFRIMVKPVSGGMAETTLNSSITELFPAIAFEKKYNAKDVQDFHKFLLGQEPKKLKCVHEKDIIAAQETINKADTSSKFEIKMNNAIAILQYIKDQNKDKPIKEVRWGYRSSSKPPGVPGNHPGDIFLIYKDNKILGVSLKAGGKKTAEPQLNTYVATIFKSFQDEGTYNKLMSAAFKSVYSKIKGLTADYNKNRKTEDVLRAFERKNNRKYEQLYDEYLELNRKAIVNRFNKDRKKTLNYIQQEVLRDAPKVPTMVIKAEGRNYSEVTDKDALGVFLPQVQFIKAYSSKSSKQNWFIDLKSGKDKLTMKMSIRTNKAGHPGVKKLGQFSLAVKYNGLA